MPGGFALAGVATSAGITIMSADRRAGKAQLEAGLRGAKAGGGSSRPFAKHAHVAVIVGAHHPRMGRYTSATLGADRSAGHRGRGRSSWPADIGSREGGGERCAGFLRTQPTTSARHPRGRANSRGIADGVRGRDASRGDGEVDRLALGLGGDILRGEACSLR